MKKVLFVSASLGLGGSEKCMAEMIRRMDLDKYEITVLALIGVENKHCFDERIRIKNGYEAFERQNMPFSRFVPYAVKRGLLGQLIAKSRYRFKVQKNVHHTSQDFWEELSEYIPPVTDEFDVVIGYGQGYATCFAVDKVPNAKRKILWLNTDLQKARYNISYFAQFYEAVDAVVADSQNGANNLRKIYPAQENVYCFPNMLDLESILEKSTLYEADYCDQGVRILTVGRFCEAKALHLAVAAARVLKSHGYEFTWYIVGDGGLRSSLEEDICNLELENNVILTGAKDNPYPWFAGCDIYVQTSVYEGSCMTINEAMVFGKPIVTTNFPAALEKIRHGENGLICSMSAESIAEAIKRLLDSEELQRDFAEELTNNPITYGAQLQLLETVLGKEEE